MTARTTRSLTQCALLGSAATVQMIIIAVKPMLYDTPRFQRYQFSLVADISGISRALASTTGLHALRALYDTTPPLDSPIIFLPQQRAMLLLQKFIAWLAPATDPEDEGLEKLGEVLEVLASILGHLIPIVQDLSGAHWDLVFDVIEMNLEVCSPFPPLLENHTDISFAIRAPVGRTMKRSLPCIILADFWSKSKIWPRSTRS